MKRLIIICIFVLVAEISLSAQDIPFVFDKNRIDVGTLYVYNYSVNRENFKPGVKRYFYINKIDDIESLCITIKDKITVFMEQYKINWDYMMLKKCTILSLKDEDKLRIGETLRSSIDIDFSKKIMMMNFTSRGKNGFKDFNRVLKFKSIPTYFYNLTDLMPLWFALRFYPLDKKEILVNHNGHGHNTKYKIKYIGKEEVDVPYGKVLCNKFEFDPQMSFAMKAMFKPKKAWIWLTSEDSCKYMVKYRNNNVRSTFTRNMEYRLSEIKKMSPEEWEKFKEKCGVKPGEAF